MKLAAPLPGFTQAPARRAFTGLGATGHAALCGGGVRAGLDVGHLGDECRLGQSVGFLWP